MSKRNKKSYYSQNKNIKSSKKMKNIFYLFMLIVLILFSILLAIIVYDNIKARFNNNKIVDENAQKYITNNKDTIIKESEDIKQEEIIGLIEEINYENKNIRVFNIKERISTTFYIDDTTMLKDKYNKARILSEFEQGDIVNIKYSKKDNKVNIISASNKSWFIESAQKINIDKINKTIKIGEDIFKYNDKLQIKYNNKNYDINSLNKFNIVNLRGIEDTVFYIEVLKSYGKLKIINYNDIEKGMLEIDAKNIISLDKDNLDKDIIIPEGSYKITLKGKNIETYNKNINIVDRELTVLDLKDVKYTVGSLTIYLNNENAKVTINDKIVDISKVQSLPYGEYIIKVESEGYVTYENIIKINKSSEKLDIVLEEELKSKEIDIKTTPSDAEIFIDGEYIGKSPIKTKVSFGKRNIYVKKEGYLDVNFSFDMNKNTDKYSITLVPN